MDVGRLQPLEMAQNKHNENLPHRRYDERDKIKSGGGDQEGTSRNPSQKKKRYHRHTLHQIQELEAFFNLCPHPDDKQRKELSRQLELEPLQVKFWFQNKRTQTKTHHERYQNSKLRVENEKLKIDNMRYRAALSNSSCPNCGGPSMMGEISLEEHHLRLENAHLREELDRVAAIAAKSMGKQVNHHLLSSPSPVARRPLELGVGFGELGQHGESSNDIFRSICGPIEADKPVIVELAVAAMEEMVTMAQMGEPLWTVSLDGTTAILNEDEYFKTFPKDASPKPSGFRCEASRESAVVTMCHINLVDIFMDVNQWSAMFSGIVSRASTTEVLSTGVAGNYDGALQVVGSIYNDPRQMDVFPKMIAEFHLPSPLVPTRESYFVRYCKQQDEGTWAIVDVSLDDLRPVPTARCRKRPSGCLIHEMPNGFSKVIWVEHVEVDDRGVHGLYKLLVNSGRAFGANRWVANLDRQCERFARAMTANVLVGEVGAITSLDGRRGMLKLADRMVTSFCAGVSASSAHTWTTLSGTGGDDVRVMTRKSINDPGRPPGIVLSAATSFWLPVLPKRIFDFLRDQNSRKEWDILSNGDAVQEVGRIASGRDAGNCVSLLRNANSVQGNMLIVQESYTNSTGSFVVYAPVEIAAINVVLNGGDTDYVALLPSGFAILPDGTAAQGGEVGPGGSLVTIAFQILVDSVPTAKLSLGCVATVNNLIVCTVERIKASLTCESA